MRQVGLGNSLWSFWWHDDIVGLQRDVLAALTQTDVSVKACKSVSADEAVVWASVYAEAIGFTKEGAAWLNTGAQADAGQAILRKIIDWQRSLQAKGCLIGPLIDPNKPGEDLTQWLKYGAIIAGSLGTAYVVSQIVSFMPSGGMRIGRRPRRPQKRPRR